MKKLLLSLLACAAFVVSCQKSTVYVSEISITERDYEVVVGGTTQIQVTVLPENAANKTLSYTPETSGICTISATGLITGVKAGTTKITIAATDGSKAYTECQVTVKEK